ncbi:hypothetical protein SASPL_122857 [Salvia splendens]|uniref:Malectin-like domain-containing protein n=1 Tax=Salvia splendens TaxID=180675 RepID=A0A8X8XK12_SALSN|nr:hypothetical protein SASPL_122857 [Salvia splendens]
MMILIACGVLRFLLLQFLILNFVCSCIGFDPKDKYYVNCGSSTDVAVGSITYIADKPSSRYLSTPEDILAHTTSNSIASSDDSVLFPTARIFTKPSTYTFPLRQSGRHWIRLRFYPFHYQNFDMKSATFSVFSSHKETRLLSDFSPQNATVNEYLLNMTSGNTMITFSPSRNSFAYVNSVEVVSAPDSLIIDDASLFNPVMAYSGLVDQALETVVRVNMGGPFVSLVNDTLGRSWVPDWPFLLHPDLATNASNIGGVRYPGGGATQDIAPPTVYGTCTKMNSQSDPNSNFNVTWNFGVDAGFQYLIRLHFCDIVSKGANQLVFDVYIGGFLVDRDLELSSVSQGRLATAYFKDFVTPLMDKDSLSVSIGPSKLSYYPDALLNGLEVMKISKKGSFSIGGSSLAPFSRSKNKLAVIVGVSVGVPFLSLIVVGILVFAQRRKKKKQEVSHSKTWIHIPVDGGASHSHNMDSNLSYCMPFAVVEEATNSFDEGRVVGVGGFGKVYKGVLGDGTKLAVKRGNPSSPQGLAEPVIDPSLPREMVNLGEWAIKWQKKGELDQIIDHRLVGRIKPDSLRKYGETAEKCLAEFGVDRPSMGDVLWNLEYALQLQEAVERDDPEESSSNYIHEISPHFNDVDTSNSFGQFERSSGDDLSDASVSKVFSQLIRSEGR